LNLCKSTFLKKPTTYSTFYNKKERFIFEKKKFVSTRGNTKKGIFVDIWALNFKILKNQNLKKIFVYYGKRNVERAWGNHPVCIIYIVGTVKGKVYFFNYFLIGP